MAMSVLLRQSVLAAALAFACTATAAAHTSASDVAATKDMLKQAVAYRTELGQVPEFARYLADKLQAAGFSEQDIEIIPVGETAAMAVRYRGRGKDKPI